MKLKGIDISEWQKDIDFLKVKADGIKFVIIREGKRQEVDDRFFEHVKECTKADIPVLGVYHFSYVLKKGDGKKEAQSCVKNIKKAGLPKDIIVFYDFEYDTVYKAKENGVKLTRTDCINFTKEFCEEIERQGCRAGIYANQDFYKNWYDPDLIGKYVFWLAHYTTGDPKYPCVFQQYTSTGHVKGINGNVDMNWFFKTGSLVDVAKSWMGKNEEDGSFKEIIDLYNSQSVLPRSYKVKYTDEWCATFVSACAIKAGLTDIVPTECSCPQMIRLFQDKGKWVEADNYIPSTGDVIFYDWQDSGSGDNTGVADHVGIVASCDGAQIQVIEGNMGSGYVGERSIRVNGKFIRGYGVPNYITKRSVAEEVISGLWGNGEERKTRLKSAGYDPDEAQKEVNRILGVKTKTVNQLAEEVIAGLWGSGDVRKKKLTDAGYDYDAVQSAVNLLVKKK